jgi:serralysin
MYGGLGNDVYIVNEYNDVVGEAVGEGYDIVRSISATYILGDNIEALELTAGAGDIFGTGNNQANSIVGNEGVNILDGRGGVDTIKGNDGNDVIFGGEGNDLLYGGSGWDVFAVRQESVSLPTLETDRIYDLSFAGGDRVDLSAIDANASMMGNQAFTFVGAFTGAAGQALLTYDAGTDTTSLKLDVNGDKKADYMLKVNGDVTGTTGDIIAPGSFLDGTGGWIL